MDHSVRVAEIFAQHMEDISATAVGANQAIAEAGEVVVHALLSDNKVLCAGSGSFHLVAQLFTSHLLNRFDRERPALPAITLSADSTLVNAISEDTQFADAIARQIGALGNAGDVLLLAAGHGRGESLIRALRAALDREMIVVLLHGQDQHQHDLLSLLTSRDVEVAIPVDSNARLLESQLVLINVLGELVDLYLFGGE